MAETPTIEATPEEAAPPPTVQEPSPEQTPNLWQKLLTAQSQVGNVTKAGRNTHHNYEYSKVEDVIKAAAKALQDAGLVGYIRKDKVEFERGQTSGGAPSLSCVVEGFLMVKDPDSLEEAAFDLYGTGIDSPGDKAYYKAMSGGKKYAYANALQIAFGDDPEDGTTPGAQAQYVAEQQARYGRFGEPAEEGTIRKAADAIRELLDPEGERIDETQAAAEALMEQITNDAGKIFPRAAARALLRVAARGRADRRSSDAEKPAEAPEPAEPTEESQEATESAPGGADGASGDDGNPLSLAILKTKAAELEIEGRSKMNREELEAAIKRAIDAKQAEAEEVPEDDLDAAARELNERGQIDGRDPRDAPPPEVEDPGDDDPDDGYEF